jgi:hypothetical protein
VVLHYFGHPTALFAAITDPRDPVRTTYPLAALLFAAVLMFLFRLGARRQIGHLLRNARCAAKFESLFGVRTVPHGDTLNTAFKRVEPGSLQRVVTSMVLGLIRSKVLARWRVFDRYYVVAVDGTGMVTFHSRHCEHCLTTTRNGTTTYYHNVLEAKLVTPNGFALSLMTQFIENPSENPRKQDCELKAFYRLAQRLHDACPRLPILLALDGLFACGPVFALCREYRWRYCIVLKDKDLPSVNTEFDALSGLQPDNRISWTTGPAGETRQQLRWVHDIEYTDTDRREHTLTVLECLETETDPAGNSTTTKFKWITDLKFRRKPQALELANNAGRLRWKIENEGFNDQKNGGFRLEHAYSQDENSCKNFYFLLQIAHLVAQLLEHGSLLKKAFPNGFGSERNIAFLLLEAWRNARLSPCFFEALFNARIQIRYDDTS